ncbi:tRNA (adenosine(37)-N6)-threonylcarbamoyltransferase complex dimerization subunit type 1 TsaB, partial [Candidatus Parcubacteria bacterium]|nr:tRNA (adenosine(37)-N6)-threonylcarbamoyltransferase complex dimerization subunit type 1 TsaB [Candidatus Parcubacteria bacterium]
MILYINTTQGDDIIIALKDGSRVVAQKKIKAKYSQAEKLLPMIDKILEQNKLNIKDIKKIQVANENGGFTALRIGVVTANALGYALSVPVKPSESLLGDS